MHLILQEILNFWFGEPNSLEYGQFRSQWFASTQEFDQTIRSKYERLYEELKKQDLREYQNTAEEMLALIILFDQFPRNMFRKTPKVFATDALARSLSQKIIGFEFDQKLPIFMQLFVYLPFEHSENLKDQELSVALF